MKLLFIGARLFDDVALYTEKMGINTILTESNPQAANLSLADSYQIVPRGMEKPKEIAIKEDVDGVIPLIGIDGPLNDVAILKEDLETNYGIPVVASPQKAVSISGDKIKTKEFLIKNEIQTPEHCLFNENHEIKVKKYPVVLKQPQGQGGKDIKIALKEEEVVDYLKQYGKALAERFLDGIEISVEVLRWDNRTLPLVPVYKGNTTLNGTHPLQKLKKAPFKLDDEDLNEKIPDYNEKIRQMALNIAELLGVEGTTDIDIIFDKKSEKTYVLEINTRPSGTRYLTNASSDINPLHEMVNMATGNWDVNSLKSRMKEYFALEVPVGDYSSERNNFQFRNFKGKNDWIIHGPPHHQRITIRGETEEKSLKIAKDLNLDLLNYTN